MSLTLEGLRLLVIDDDDDLRSLLATRFRRQGALVREAEDGKAALQALHEDQPIDVALLDLHLPDCSGVDLLGQLKDQAPELEVIMLTAHGSLESAIEAMRHGAYDYLLKPVRFNELEIRLDKAREKATLRRREQQWIG